ncbi:MAG: AEC family transporter [Deltaproteobacteria bacterium]|nr:AEC family transporter [Deltaproteobacteria bacterium]
MARVITTIIPIFMLIFLGALSRRLGFMKDDFIVSANRLVFYLAIPALVFRALSRAALRDGFAFWPVFTMTAAVLAVVGLALLLAFAGPWRDGAWRATFIQSTVHGNLGYIGLAVAFYYLDEVGFARAGMLVGFLMIVQNLFGVLLLQYLGRADHSPRRGRRALLSVLLNPVIIAALSGMLFNLSGLLIPEVIDRFFMILSGLALPMGLLLIGASISFALLRRWLLWAGVIAFCKLLLLPGLAYCLFSAAGFEAAARLPALILLAAPTATLTYVMAREMGGQADLAVAAVSLTTMLSAFTYAFWLGLPG